MIAMGGGILIASVAFVLVPHGMALLTPLIVGISLMSGALTFAFLDQKIARSGSSKSQVLAMLMDFIPEVLALGASFSHDPKLGLLLALFIGIQNFPEGFNAYNELMKSLKSQTKTLFILGGLSLIGIIPTLLGYLLLSNSSLTIATIMIFSAGGILYLMFQDIIPMSKLKNSGISALTGVFGFLIGMLGYMFFS